MDVLREVKSLFAVAADVIFENLCDEIMRTGFEVLAEQDLTDDNSDSSQPADKRRKVESTEKKPAKVLEFIRDQFNEYLVSSYSQVRWELMDRFIARCCPGHLFLHFIKPMYFNFLNTVLDSSFKKLELSKKIEEHLDLALATQLLKIISSRSPLLQTLQLPFFLEDQTAPLGSSFCKQLGKLTHLTSLTLSFKTSDQCLDLFSSLSQSCSRLATLSLGKIPFDSNQVLALMLGSKRALLPRTFPKESAKLISIQFTAESVSPICSSLKCLHYDCDEAADDCNSPPLAFILRHFKNLEKLDCLSCGKWATGNGMAVQNLHQSYNTWKSLPLQKNSISSCVELGLIQWTVNAPFTGQLSLVVLKGVDIESRKMMQAVTALCPNLREVQFRRYGFIGAHDRLSVQELHSILLINQENFGCWLKVTRVSFTLVETDYRKIIVSVIGHQLKTLEFSSFSYDIDLIPEVFPCIGLEELKIGGFCNVMAPPPGYNLPSISDFLPHLKRLKLRICLGLWSPIFECHRPTFTTLNVICIHIGVPNQSEFEWGDVPKLWPNIRELHMINAEGLTLDFLMEFVPKLKHLQILSFSNDVFTSFQDHRRFNKFKAELCKKNPTSLVIGYN